LKTQIIAGPPTAVWDRELLYCIMPLTTHYFRYFALPRVHWHAIWFTALQTDAPQ
jgi:hypothetical protein